MTTQIKLLYNGMLLPSVVVHTCNPRSWEMQTGELIIILRNLTSSSETLSQNKAKEDEMKPRNKLVENTYRFASFQLGIIVGLISFKTTSN